MELRERLTRSRASQEDAKCGGRPYQRPTGPGEATAAAQTPERPGARRLQPRKAALQLFCLLPVLVCLACALVAAVQGKKRSPPPLPRNPLNNPEFFKDFKSDIVNFFSGYDSAQFNQANRIFEDINLNGVPASNYTICSLLEVYLRRRWTLIPEFVSRKGGNDDLRPIFSVFCLSDDDELGSSKIERGDTNGFVTNYCNDPPFMPPECLLTGGSVTVDVTDATGVVHHLLIVMHPAEEAPLDNNGPFFRTYMGKPKDRTAYLRAILAAELPTVPAVLYAKRVCVGYPYRAIDLSVTAACVAGYLQASSVFNGAPPRAVALIAEVKQEGQRQKLFRDQGFPDTSISPKICLERIPDATIVNKKGKLEVDRESLISTLYVLHPQPSSIPPAAGSAPP